MSEEGEKEDRHPRRQYILAIDPARSSDCRDLLFYFRHNIMALKFNATQAEGNTS